MVYNLTVSIVAQAFNPIWKWGQDQARLATLEKELEEVWAQNAKAREELNAMGEQLAKGV